jgi:hypothetical protein
MYYKDLITIEKHKTTLLLTKETKITKSENFGVRPLRNKLTFRTMDLLAAITEFKNGTYCRYFFNWDSYMIINSSNWN